MSQQQQQQQQQFNQRSMQQHRPESVLLQQQPTARIMPYQHQAPQANNAGGRLVGHAESQQRMPPSYGRVAATPMQGGGGATPIRNKEPRQMAMQQQSTSSSMPMEPPTTSKPIVHFHGHDPRLNGIRVAIPPELCLIGCVFLIVDYERILDQKEVSDWRIVIAQHGGDVETLYSAKCTHVVCESLRHPVVQQALKDGRRCVTAQWLNDCLACKKLAPPWKAVHFPSAYGENKPCKNRIFSISGFNVRERSCLKQMIMAVGARYTAYFSKLNHLLIAKTLSGPKVLKASEWKVPIVNLQWLTELFFGQTASMQNINNPKYRQFFSKELCQQANFDPFRIDAAAAMPLLMSWFIRRLDAWRVPVTFTADTWKAAAKKRYKIEHDDGKIFVFKKIRLSPSPEDDGANRIVRADASDVRVCFTGLYPTEVMNLAKKIVWLGGKVVTSVLDCTHLVTVDLKRTRKLLEGIALGRYILTPQWVRQSYKQQSFLEAMQFIVKDEGNEKFFGFNVKLSIFRARQKRMFEKILFYLTPSVQPLPSILSEIVQTAGGSVLKQRPSSKKLLQLREQGVRFVIITCDNDFHLCQTLVQTGIDVHSAEFILTGILRQELDFQSYRLEPRSFELIKANKTEQPGTSIKPKNDQKLNLRPLETPTIPAVRLRSKTDLGVVIKRWGIASEWRWKTEEEVCGICRLAFESPCPDCTMPGDDCRVDWGTCNHCYHRHCINKWLTRSDSRGSCPLCRQEWRQQMS
ncbi:zf-Apc11 and PTCB-BRCT and BRCT domain containing protein [Trichuris trichiura]|uniref:Anaphase-promoting complex subunit 11 n=1 Tax=Trichuris trichiura TaxID=36087 RepID=A0A077Z438_TRITR|nr:zf-Apc11 and PTCB-BRCT and BRCT domain containing protein [Trichuris trichiura]